MIILISVNKNNLKVVMDRFAPIIQAAVKERMSSEGKNATGKTSSSIFARTFERKDSIGINVGGGYGFPFLHTGRRPGATQPPYRVIADWMKAKGISEFAGSLNKSAYLIARAIGKRGIRANNISGKAVQRIINRLLNDTSEAYIKDVEQHLKKFTKNA